MYEFYIRPLRLSRLFLVNLRRKIQKRKIELYSHEVEDHIYDILRAISFSSVSASVPTSEAGEAVSGGIITSPLVSA